MVPLESLSTVAYSLSMGLSCIVPEIKRDIDRKSQFLSRISTAILTRDIDVAIPSVCPSVRLSVCPSVRLSVCPSVTLLYRNDLTYRHALLIRHQHMVAQSF